MDTFVLNAVGFLFGLMVALLYAFVRVYYTSRKTDNDLQNTKATISVLRKIDESDRVVTYILKDGGIPPYKKHVSDGAWDLPCPKDIVVPPNVKGMLIDLGVSFCPPRGAQGLLLLRSSTGVNTPLRQSNHIALIDNGYRGSVKLALDNTSDKPYKISRGDRLAQIFWIAPKGIVLSKVSSLDDTDRGVGGFGSTGK